MIVLKSAQLLDRAWKVDAAGILLLGVLTLGGYLAGVGPFLGARVDKARHDVAMADAVRSRDDARASCARSGKLLAEKREQTNSEVVSLHPVAQRHVQLGAIAQLAQSTRIMVDQVTPADAMPIEGIPSVVRVPITLTGKGSYAQVSLFLSELHSQFRDTSVASVQLRAEPGSKGSVALFSVVLHWYAHPDIPT
jgi:hypothetical protein